MAVGEETIRQIESKGRHFNDVRPRSAVDYLLRTAQQHHVQLSVMADTKASILITVSSIVVTLSLGRASDPQLRPALMTLALSCVISLALAIVAVLPKFGKQAAGTRNLLFFGHFATMTEDEFMSAIERVVTDDNSVYEAATRDLYSLGTYLHRKKYRFLRYAYLALIGGFVLATLVEIYVLLMWP